MSDKNTPNTGHEAATLERTKTKLVPPSMYNVLLHNDDYTPMDFVVEILIEIFRKDELTATKLMLEVHNLGKAICGVYTYEIAETKIARVHELAQQFEYPLQASMEEE